MMLLRPVGISGLGEMSTTDRTHLPRRIRSSRSPNPFRPLGARSCTSRRSGIAWDITCNQQDIKAGEGCYAYPLRKNWQTTMAMPCECWLL